MLVDVSGPFSVMPSAGSERAAYGIDSTERLRLQISTRRDAD
jgi:hypothetical protein